MADSNAELRANTGSQEEMISGQDDSINVSPGKQDDNMLKHNTDTEDVKEKIHCAENEFFNNKSDNNVEGSNSSSASVTCTHTSDSKSSETLDNAEGKCSGNVSVTGTEESDSESSEYESAEEDQNIVEVEHEEEDIEEVLTEEVKKERRSQAQVYKDEGNDLFKKKEYDLACKQYSKALRLCPKDFVKDRSIMYSNRAACKMKKELNEEAIKDSTKALELHPHYMKALIRRAELYEKVDRLEEALADYQRAIELDPTQHGARAACMRLPDQIKEKNEKLKEEMLGKLKELGNMVLKPFGLSTNNFQMNQDPKTGGYSINFKQNS